MAQGRAVVPSHFPAIIGEVSKDNSNGNTLELLSLLFHKVQAELERRLIENALSASGEK